MAEVLYLPHFHFILKNKHFFLSIYHIFLDAPEKSSLHPHLQTTIRTQRNNHNTKCNTTKKAHLCLSIHYFVSAIIKQMELTQTGLIHPTMFSLFLDRILNILHWLHNGTGTVSSTNQTCYLHSTLPPWLLILY